METITAGCQSSNRRHYRFPAQGDSSHFQNVRLDGFCLTVKGQSKTPPSRVCSIAMRSWSVASLKKQNVGEMFLVSQYSRARVKPKTVRLRPSKYSGNPGNQSADFKRETVWRSSTALGLIP